jgi:hypothetical protein
MLWFMANYANKIAEQKRLGIRFQAIVPQQIIGGTGVGDEASAAYAGARGIEREAFLAQFGAPLPPRAFGEPSAAAPLTIAPNRAHRGAAMWLRSAK